MEDSISTTTKMEKRLEGAGGGGGGGLPGNIGVSAHCLFSLQEYLKSVEM